MVSDRPLISISMVTYNHERYIAEAIQSVLDQSLTDFELIIVNDGSTDKTDEIIRSFDDNRIVYITQENQGPSAATCAAVLSARGKFIALTSGDDVWVTQRLEKQYQYLHNSDHKIIFSWVDFIDDLSRIISSEHFAEDVFNCPSQSRADILNHFFFKGNYLCGVSALIEKEIIVEAGLFNLASIQLQDFDLWIKLVKKYDFLIIPERLVKYRIRSGGQNLSDPGNNIRTLFESFQIWRTILDDVPIDLFRVAFRNNLKNPDFTEGIEYELEKAFLYLGHSIPLLRSIGAEKLFFLLQDKAVLEVSKKAYNFDLPALYELTKNLDVTNIEDLHRLNHDLQEHSKELSLAIDQIRDLQTQLQLTQETLKLTQNDLKLSQENIQILSNNIAAMESSKFWKLRQRWMHLKQRLGLPGEE
jgi:glycosyltransferase involved in cell wall biosynthesis